MGSKSETRAQILEAAERLFLRFGPVKTTVADIARELRMSPANIYNFFPSRDAILEAAGEQHFAALQNDIVEQVRATSGDWARIERIFLTTFGRMRDKVANEKDIIQLQALEQDNEWQFVKRHLAFLHSMIASILDEGVAEGRLFFDDTHGTARALLDCMASAVDPLMIMRAERQDHECRVRAQLGLLARAFR